jgi:chromosome segregation ATPase
MSAGNNFVDLRVANAGIAGETEDSVWPAFTDIMTVVLMIFLMSLVAFLIRNTQLLDELQTTLIEKDQISEQADLSAELNSALKTQLALVRERILSLESSLQSVTGAKDQLQQSLEQREQAVRDLETEIALLTRLRDQLSNSNSDLFNQLDLNRLALAQTEQSLSERDEALASTGQQLTQTQEKLGESTRQGSLSEEQLAASRASLQQTRITLSATELALAEVEAEFSENKNTLNEKISLLLAAKAGLIIAKEKGDQSLTDSEAARLELNRQVIALSEQLRLVRDNLDSQNTKNEALDSQLEDQKLILEGLSLSKEELQQKLQEMVANLNQLQELYDLRGSVVDDLQAQLLGDEQRYKSLQEEFDSLDDQYRKLIRPARSTAGKYVVSVYFSKQDGQAVYRISEPGQDAPDTLTLAELESRLTVLKEQYMQQLYTKVRIDDSSGVEFNEAWRFTQKMLADYDYYSNDYSELVSPAESEPGEIE